MTEEYDDDPGYFFPEDREDEFPEKKDGAELEPWQITGDEKYDEFLLEEGSKFFGYKIWVKEKRINSLKKLHEWFLNERNQEYRDDYFLDEERCLELYLFEKRKNRKLAEEIMSILCTWEPYYLYEFLLDSMEKFLTNEEIRKLKERRYRIWLQENKIISLKDIYEWFTKRFERGVLVSRSGSEGREAYEHLEQFLEEMPLTRESAEIILKYSEYFPTDELTYILSTRFRHFLTKEEIAEYLYE